MKGSAPSAALLLLSGAAVKGLVALSAMRSQAVSSATVCWNFRRVSRMTNSTSCGLVQHDEMGTQQVAEGVQRQVGFARFANPAQPVFLLREFLQPGVGRRDHQHSPRIQPFVNRLQESSWGR